MTKTSIKRVRKLTVTDDNLVLIGFSGRTQLVQAKVLDVRRNSDGLIEYLLLDRLIHDHDEDEFLLDHCISGEDDRKLMVTGAYVTELSLAEKTLTTS